MTEQLAVNVLREAVWTIFLVSAPILGLTLIIGLLISIFQAATSINEMTMTYVPKIIIVAIVGILTLPWMLEMLMNFAKNIFNIIPTLTK
jgi:flagellar biosynthesis protein FliQ